MNEAISAIQKIVEQNLDKRRVLIYTTNQKKWGYFALDHDFVESDFPSKDELINNDNYLIFDRKYSKNYEELLEKYSLKDVRDYLWYTPKPINLKGDCALYKDIYGNYIENMNPNINFWLEGYSIKILIDKSSTFAPNIRINARTATNIEIAGKCKFSANIVFDCFYNSSTIINTCSFGKDSYIGCGENGHILLNERGVFDHTCEFVANSDCSLTVGAGALSSRFVNLRAGDGHGIFDIKKMEKRNFKKNDARNNTVIGEHVWIAYGAVILNPSVVGSGCIVGAKSLVKGKFANNVTIAGNPGRVVRSDTAWSPDLRIEDINIAFKNYAYFNIPTIYSERMTDSKKNLNRIIDFKEYLKVISGLDKTIILISVKDIIGHKITGAIEEIENLGISSDLKNKKGWYGFVFASNDGNVLLDKITENEEEIYEQLQIENTNFALLSAPLHAGNRASIRANGYEYSPNERGFNIVVFDKETQQVCDAVSFDTHSPGFTCTRHILFA